MALLEVAHVHTFYGDSHILADLSLDVAEGEVVCLLGRNGAGKSTTLKSIVGVAPPRSGRITLRGQELAGLPPFRVAQLGIGYVPEDRRVFPNLTVHENLEVARRTWAHTGGDGATELWTEDVLFDLFPILRERRRQLGGTLSGGEQQMLAVARALMSRPRLLLLDEPSLGLAPQVVETIFAVIKGVNSEGVAVLLVEQNAHKALMIAHRAYVLETGKVATEGAGKDLLASPEIQKAYLGG